MDRLELVQAIIDKRSFTQYLEIGVLTGYVFFPVKCKNKIAVDPNFRFGWKEKLRSIRRNFSNINSRYFETTSDDFFSRYAPGIFDRKKLDICFVDGMHEFRYVLNDIENSLRYLQDDGVIILHDCNPLSPEAECSFADWEKRGFTGFWNGDTWKAITYLLHNRPDLDVFTADCDFGLGVVTKAKQARPTTTPKTFEEINRLTYNDLSANREQFLNLKPEGYLKEYFSL